MRVVVDTSVWSLALRRRKSEGHAEAALLRRLIEDGEDIYLLGIILQEILQGVREPSDFASLREHLEAFPTIEVAREDYVKAAALKNRLLRKGVQASTVDALIASVSISYECRLFTADKDFTRIASHSALKLLSS